MNHEQFFCKNVGNGTKKFENHWAGVTNEWLSLYAQTVIFNLLHATLSALKIMFLLYIVLWTALSQFLARNKLSKILLAERGHHQSHAQVLPAVVSHQHISPIFKCEQKKWLTEFCTKKTEGNSCRDNLQSAVVYEWRSIPSLSLATAPCSQSATARLAFGPRCPKQVAIAGPHWRSSARVPRSSKIKVRKGRFSSRVNSLLNLPWYFKY